MKTNSHIYHRTSSDLFIDLQYPQIKHFRTPHSIRRDTMHGPVAKTLEQILDAAGIPNDHKMALYLRHIGVKQPSQFALMFKDSDAVDTWCQKFKSRVTFGDEEIHITDDAHTAMTGAITAAFLECQDILGQQRQAMAPTPPFTPALPSASPLTTTPSLEDKVPKTWPAGEYQTLIRQYHENSGKTRHFPEKTVLGADRILVRMWHEHHKSKNYTAVTLGEIITNRTFTATGTVNATVKRDRLDKTLTIDTSNNTLVQQETKDWDPQTSMMIIDALDAIQWAWILVQIGTETEITTYIDRFKTLTRRNAHRLPNIKALWDTFAWEIAVHMHTSTTFGQITANLLADPIQLADILSQPLTKKLKGKKGDGKGKRKGKKGNTWQNHNWYNRQYYNLWRPSPYSQQDNTFYGPAPRPQIQQYQAFPPAPPPPANTTTPYNSYHNEKGKGKQKGKYNNPNKGYKGQGKNK